MNPKVSIIVPCYNQGCYLAEALDSVLRQTFQNWECIIINDGSTDDSEKVAISYTKRDSRLKYIYQENQGVIASRNNAIRQSSGKYILPLDADDKIASDYIEKAVCVLDNNEDVKIVYGEVQLFGAASGRYELLPYTLPRLMTSNCISNSSFFRKADFDRCGGYNPNMKDGWEDWDFWISIMEMGGKVHKLPSVGHIYRIQGKSRNISAKNNVHELYNQIWQNHLGLYQQEFQKYADITGSRLFKVFHLIRKIKKYFK